jgi:hypothetical protein
MDLDQLFGATETSKCLLYTNAGEKATNQAGEHLFIEVYGSDSDTYRNTQNKQQNKRLQKARYGRNKQITSEEMQADALELIISCVKSWNLEKDGEQLPFDEKNVRELLKAYPKMFKLLDAHIHDEINFLTD